jgi:hypothetical protein
MGFVFLGPAGQASDVARSKCKAENFGGELGYDRRRPGPLEDGLMEQERRRVPRFQFIAPAELVDEISGTRFNSWVADLGSQGCGLSGSTPTRVGASVRVKIGADPREAFHARAVIVYSAEDHTGVSFKEVKPTSSLILHKWLASAKFPKGPV